MSRKFRESNPFWQRLQSQLDEQFAHSPIPDPPDAAPLQPLEGDGDERRVKSIRLAIARGEHQEKPHV